jgi:hypothetical protein
MSTKAQRHKYNHTPEATARRKTYQNTDAGIASKRNYSWRRAGIVMTQEHYLQRVEACGNQCPLCTHKENAERIEKDERLHVDHCHVTGVVRGLLCKQHNMHLAYFENCLPELLKYLNYGIT